VRHVSISIADINAMRPDEFVAALGGVFEHSPWIAERAFVRRPFADMAGLHEAMVDVVRSASREEQLGLLRAHPELAGREAQAGTLTADSTAEQRSAGLNALTRDEMARVARLNHAYRDRFGFPFIIAVRRHSKDGIFAEFERRLGNDAETERRECLEQVYIITRLRLDALVAA
jgi:2-oxo-4-hydroxy-4-carboxy-5-ureidoimidazoline decarboxylase